MTTHEQFKIPHLTTALSGPLRDIEKIMLQHQVSIEAWLRNQYRLSPPPITCSVDIRNAGWKVAPVDTNLFPAGFNNLNPDFLPLAIQAAQTALNNICPDSIRVLLIPENHTRNQYYFESLATLHEILYKAGFAVRIGSLAADITEPREINLREQRKIILEPVRRENNRLKLDDFEPCIIILNNDFADGIPNILRDLTQPIIPSLQLGWSRRLKSTHFALYQQVINEFADVIKIDPWLISPYFRNCGEVDFMTGAGEKCLIHNATKLFEQITEKYQAYHITEKPFLVIKADAGTYGIGVMMIDSVEQLTQMNRKQRTNMMVAKGKQPINKVIMQEGVYTFETWRDAVAEPVVYMMGSHVIGGFYRVHAARSNTENLNSPGMYFEPLAFADCCNNPCNEYMEEHHLNRFYTYGVIARLALLAAARESKQVLDEK